MQCERKEDVVSRSTTKHGLGAQLLELKSQCHQDFNWPNSVISDRWLYLSEPQSSSCVKWSLKWIKEYNVHL